MANTAWYINPDTHDLDFDEKGILKTIEENETAAQNIRLTLEAGKGDFDLVPSHGTDYAQILGQPVDAGVADEVIREAIFQEDRLASIDEISIKESDRRGLEISFSGTLNDGEGIHMEVTSR